MSKNVKCQDGFSMSVQASSSHYCDPKSDTGPWSHVEVGYPSELDMLLWPYAENPGSPTDTIYGYVPSKIIRGVVEAHGGLVDGEMPLLIEEREKC